MVEIHGKLAVTLESERVVKGYIERKIHIREEKVRGCVLRECVDEGVVWVWSRLMALLGKALSSLCITTRTGPSMIDL